jgi:hypothetical protein
MAVLLAGVLCLQVAPLQVFQIESASHHHACAERGFCPRNPDGPCTCNHHGPEAGHDHTNAPAADAHAPQTPTMQSCGSPTDAPLLSNGLLKGVFATVYAVATPPRSDQWALPVDALAPQQRGADIFRPPKAHLG